MGLSLFLAGFPGPAALLGCCRWRAAAARPCRAAHGAAAPERLCSKINSDHRGTFHKASHAVLFNTAHDTDRSTIVKSREIVRNKRILTERNVSDFYL